ncbi:hypothetical protein PFLUV_G00105910 [Perca fluviatilis]|uniref:Uncharacterized protein n=1 Tax=Perca fluviatilis TaxID=8168 RepID=A0A6A5F7T8_PERFL|nr:hypothetical protein PFLUV_G00105910 [Perca fluviatilis]
MTFIEKYEITRARLLFSNGPFSCLFSAAAETLSALTCNVTEQHEGLYVYLLSRVPNLSISMSSGCGASWEQLNKTVIGRTESGGDPVSDVNLVQDLTNRSVTLKQCYDYLRYTKDCGTWEEAVCRVNCSAVLDLKDRLPTTVNATQTCFTENLCLYSLTFGLCVTGFLLGVAIVGVLYFWKTGKRRRRESAQVKASHTPAKNLIV